MKTDAEIKVLINNRFKSIDGREAGLNNDTLEAVLLFWKNNLGSELVFYKTNSGTDQNLRIAIGFNVNKSGTQFTADAPGKYWMNFQWVSSGGYYHSISEYNKYTMTYDCPAAYDNLGTYFENVYTTIEKALEAERNLFQRMANSLKKQSPTIQSKFKSELLNLYGVSFTDAAIENIFNQWTNNKVCFSRPISGSRVQVWVGTLSSVSDTEISVAANSTVIYQDNSYNTISNAVTSTYQEYPTQYYFSTQNDFYGSVTINGQSIPNEIRLLKNMSTVSKTYNNITDYLTDIGKIILPTEDRPGHLLGPDGNYYKYLATFVGAAGGPGTYKIYSNYRFCTSKEYTVSSGNMFLLSGAKGTGGINNIILIDLSTNLGTNTCGYTTRISGQSITETPIVSGTYNNGTFPYQWAINISESEAITANIPVFDTNQEALKYLIQSERSFINAQDFPDEIMLLGPGLDFTDYTTFNNTLKEITNGIGLKQSLYTDYLYPIFSNSNKVYCLCVLKFSGETQLYYFYNNTDGETFKLTDVSYVVNSSSSADFINNSFIKLNTNFFYGNGSEISTKGSTGSTINAGSNYHLYSGTGVLVKQFNNKIY